MVKKDSYLPLVKKFIEKEPHEAASALEDLSAEEAGEIFSHLPLKDCALLIPYLSTDFASELAQSLKPEFLSKLIENLDGPFSAKLLRSLPKEINKTVIKSLSPEKRHLIRELFTFPSGSAGRLMSTNVTFFYTGTQVREAIEKIRSLTRKQAPMTYTFIVDPSQRLVGVLNMRDLLLAKRDEPVERIMRTEVISVNGFTSFENLTQLFQEKKLIAVPVVDSENRLLGIVRSNQILKKTQEEMGEDLLKIFGVGKEETSFSPIPFSLKTRLPWLHINLLTAFIAASVVSLFEGVIAKITVLAVFLPVVAGQGGNAGAQSLAVVMRGLVMREIPKGKVKGLIAKEAFLGTLNGIIIGLVTGLIAYFWKGNAYLGLVVALAMIVNLAVAGLAGALIPITMKALKQDPAQSSNIFLTTVTDVVGFFAFLGFAFLFESFLIGTR